MIGERLSFNHFAYQHPARVEEFLRWARGRVEEPTRWEFEDTGEDYHAYPQDYDDGDDYAVYKHEKDHWQWHSD
jgi:hypothetical protein